MRGGGERAHPFSRSFSKEGGAKNGEVRRAEPQEIKRRTARELHVFVFVFVVVFVWSSLLFAGVLWFMLLSWSGSARKRSVE